LCRPIQSIGFVVAISNWDLRRQRADEVAIQSYWQTGIDCRSRTRKTAAPSARCNRCRFVLDVRSGCHQSGLPNLLRRSHFAAQSNFTANCQIDGPTFGCFFPIAPVEKYFKYHPHRNIVLMSDLFSDVRHFKRSSFYRRCMAPINGRCAIGLFFWGLRRLLAAIIVVRNAQQASSHRAK
jgi:hypothetical protein